MLGVGFHLTAPTINSWANRLCSQWDLYLSTAAGSLGQPEREEFKVVWDNLAVVKFKTTGNEVRLVLLCSWSSPTSTSGG